MPDNFYDAVAYPIDVPRNFPQVTIDFPVSWPVEHVDCSLRTGTPDGGLIVRCQSVWMDKERISSDAVESISQTLELGTGFQMVGDSKVEETVIDSKRAYKLAATGTFNKAEAHAVGYLIPIAEENGFVLVYWGTTEAIKKEEALMKKVIGSMKRKVK